jgi:hypothetical protein
MVASNPANTTTCPMPTKTANRTIQFFLTGNYMWKDFKSEDFCNSHQIEPYHSNFEEIAFKQRGIVLGHPARDCGAARALLKRGVRNIEPLCIESRFLVVGGRHKWSCQNILNFFW